MIKLLVLEELKRLGKDWSYFLFSSGFEVDYITPKINPKPRYIPSPSMAEKFELVIMETEPLQKVDTPKATLTKQKPKVRKNGRNRVTRSQTVAKGNLEEIFHAIDIEETPIVQAEDIDEGGRKLKKLKTAKNLEFAGEDIGFMFQARKPMTRHAINVLERNK